LSGVSKMVVFSGAYTALVTPMRRGGEVDYGALERLVEFQVEGEIRGILAVGTTGESPTLTWDEHNEVTGKIHEHIGGRCTTIAGTGSNCTEETMKATRHSSELGIGSVLLVDPYYNGPSSLEIRLEYVAPVAEAFPGVQVIPYVIPGRTGAQLLPQDLAVLHSEHANVRAVKEATGNLDNMRLTRRLCGGDFDILSGDDNMTYAMMTSPEIRASGVISVTSNVAPGAVQQMTRRLLEGDVKGATELSKALDPLFNLVTVKTEEETPFGPAPCKARNPLPYKALMNVLGMPAGPCRQPLGKMTKRGLDVVLTTARRVYEANPEVLEPVENFFDVDLGERLHKERFWRGLAYA